jgi:hypothetical protein
MAQNAIAAVMTSDPVGRNAIDVSRDENDDGAGFLSTSVMRRQYTDYIGNKILEIEEQKQSRHYYHGAHWTAEEIRILKKRRQPVVVYNRVNRKVDSIMGLVEKLRQDPKAFPRKPNDDDGAAVATQAIRTVLDQIDWRTLDHDATERCAIEGIGGIELKLANRANPVGNEPADPEVTADYIFGEDFYYDPRSRRPDFTDARYMGIAKFLDIEAAIELFPEKEDELRAGVDHGFEVTTHSDQEIKWVYTSEKRIRLCEHWYKHKGRWCWCFFVGDVKLDEGVSPFRDENSDTMCRFIMFSAAVDHDADRYGFPRNLKGPQDEINMRRSKALHISNSRRIISEKGAVQDVEKSRNEWARADGWLEINPGFSDKIKVDETAATDLAAQMQFLTEAKNEIDSFANVNPALLAQGDPSEHSGVAIDLMQRAGLAELSKFLLAHRTWRMRVYRAIWGIVQQYWTAERWLRVTDDQKVVNFIQLNGVGIDRNPQSPNFGKPVLVNAVGEIDVEIILDEGPDVASVMQDAYEIIKGDPTIPATVKIEVSPLPAPQKQRILGVLQQAAKNQPPDPKVQTEQLKSQNQAQQNQVELQKANMQTQAEIFNARQDAMAREQDAQLAANKAAAEREHLQLEMQFKQAEHRDRMVELAMKSQARTAEHHQKMQAMSKRPQQKGTQHA